MDKSILYSCTFISDANRLFMYSCSLRRCIWFPIGLLRFFITKKPVRKMSERARRKANNRFAFVRQCHALHFEYLALSAIAWLSVLSPHTYTIFFVKKKNSVVSAIMCVVFRLIPKLMNNLWLWISIHNPHSSRCYIYIYIHTPSLDL